MKTVFSRLAALVLAGCLPMDGEVYDDPPDVVRRELTVHYHETTTFLDNGRVDAILADTTDALRTDDGGDDVACDVRLVRKGGVTRFSTGDGSIDSRAEFNAVAGPPGHVKLVDEINWCGRLAPNVVGCAQPGRSLIVAATIRNLEGILWAHEYGHTKGLEHQDSDDRIMYESLATNRRKISRAECDTFRERDDSSRFFSATLPEGF